MAASPNSGRKTEARRDLVSNYSAHGAVKRPLLDTEKDCLIICLFNNLPVRVLSSHLAIPKGVEIASSDLHLFAIQFRTGQKPFRHPGIAAHKVLKLAVVDIGRCFEASQQ